MTMPSVAQIYLLKQPLNLTLCHYGRDKLQDARMRVKTTRLSDLRLSRSILSQPRGRQA